MLNQKKNYIHKQSLSYSLKKKHQSKTRENKTKESFLLSRERWRKIHGLTLSRDWQGLQDFLTEEGVTKQYSEAVLRDLVEMVQAKHTQLDASSVTLESFKLQSIGKERLSVFKIAMLDVNLKNHFSTYTLLFLL